MKQYKTNTTKGFCGTWTKSKSAMEYVSNMLDQGDYSFSFEDDSATFINHNVQVSHKALLLGLSDKTHNASLRGVHGSGYGQAMAALLAQGVSITIENGTVQWVPAFEFSDQWDEEVLVINETNLPTPTTHHSITLSDLDSIDIDEIKQRCLEFQDTEVLHSTAIGDLISGSGEIYVGDMFVTQNEDLAYSYNFKPEVLPLNQDRSLVDSWKLRTLTAKLLSMVDDPEFIAEAIKSSKYDTQLLTDRYCTDNYVGDSHAAVEVLAKEYLEEHSGSTVTSCYITHQEQEKLGNASVYIDNATQVKSIQESTAYQESLEDIEVVEALTPQEVIEAFKGSLTDYLGRLVTAEELADVVESFEQLEEISNDWSGEFNDSLPF